MRAQLDAAGFASLALKVVSDQRPIVRGRGMNLLFLRALLAFLLLPAGRRAGAVADRRGRSTSRTRLARARWGHRRSRSGRRAALRARFLRRRQGHVGAVGSAAASGRRRLVPLHAQPDVRRRGDCSCSAAAWLPAHGDWPRTALSSPSRSTSARSGTRSRVSRRSSGRTGSATAPPCHAGCRATARSCHCLTPRGTSVISRSGDRELPRPILSHYVKSPVHTGNPPREQLRETESDSSRSVHVRPELGVYEKSGLVREATRLRWRSRYESDDARIQSRPDVAGGDSRR